MKVENINNPLIWLLLEPVVEIWQLEFFWSKIWPIRAIFVFPQKSFLCVEKIFFSFKKCENSPKKRTLDSSRTSNYFLMFYEDYLPNMAYKGKKIKVCYLNI
jgi:hypothetical protein